MIINHNIAALNTSRSLNSASGAQSKSMEKLSSGLRINRAGDDAAGLAISEKMRGQIRGLDQASRNAQDGISLIQTAEGALSETHDILQRIRELAVQSSSDTNTDADRSELQKEVDQLSQEITRIANDTEFNTKSLLNGAVSDNGTSKATFQIGANQGQNMTLSIGAMDAKSLGVAVDATTFEGTGADQIKSATFADKVGSAIVDGATIDVTFTAGTTKTAGVYTFENTGTDDVVIDGETLTTPANDAALKSAIESNTKLKDIYEVTITAPGKFTLTQKAGNESSTGPTVTGNGVTNLKTTTEGVASDSSAKITLNIAGGANQEIEVSNTNDTKFSVTSGAFKGLSVDLGTAKISDLTATAADTITVTGTTTQSTAAVFTDGVNTSKAVAAKGIDISDQTAADAAITTIDNAITTVSSERSKLGAVQNRLEHTINNLGTSSENLTAAESRIRDVDMASEMVEQTKNSILAQAAQAMLAQANQQPQAVLQLLR